jgi:hypothetical protein
MLLLLLLALAHSAWRYRPAGQEAGAPAGSYFRRRDGSTDRPRPAADAMASAAFRDSGSIARLRTQAAPRTGRL